MQCQHHGQIGLSAIACDKLGIAKIPISPRSKSSGSLWSGRTNKPQHPRAMARILPIPQCHNHTTMIANASNVRLQNHSFTFPHVNLELTGYIIRFWIYVRQIISEYPVPINRLLSVTARIETVKGRMGIIAYIRNDLPHRRRDDLELLVNPPIEALATGIMVKKETWSFICLYNPHNRHTSICCNMIDVLLEKTRCSAQLTNVLGNLNISGLCENDFRCLQDVMDIHDMFNIIDKPTCFKTYNNTLMDVILTSNISP